MLPPGLIAAPGLSYQALVEMHLVPVRWVAVLLCLLLAVGYQGVSRPVLLALALTFGAGNVWVTSRLRSARIAEQLHPVRRVATALEWSVGLGIVALFGADQTSRAPAVLLLLILVTAARYGVRGLIASLLLAMLTLVAQTVVQATVLKPTTTEEYAEAALAGWILLVVLMALVASSPVRAWEVCCRQQQGWWSAHGETLRRLQAGLSERE